MMGSTCPLCASADVRLGLWGLGACNACGHRFEVNPPSAEDAAALYDEAYFRGAVYTDYLGEHRQRTRAFAEKIRLVSDLLPTGGSVLDIGCAAGFFLAVMRKRGFRVQGVEISEFAAVHACQSAHVHVHLCQLPEAGLPAESFELISFWDSLEHLADPVTYLREARRLLKSRGLLLVETLNVRTSARLLLGAQWPLFAPPYHLHYFSRRSLTALLKREGFRVIRAVPIQTYVAVGGRIQVWRYYPSPLLRTLVGAVADDVILYAAVKAAGQGESRILTS